MAVYDKYLPYARQVEAETGIPVAIILGQAMLEGGASLNSGLVQKANNFFGIKGKGNAGSVIMPTKEEVNGKMVTVQGTFRKYSSPYESFMDHARLLQNPRYATRTANATTLEDWATGIWKGGYATDSQYVPKLMNVIKSNGLDKLGSVGSSGEITIPTNTSDVIPTPTYNAIQTWDNPLNPFDQVDWSKFWGGVIKWVVLLVLFIIGTQLFLKSFSQITDPVKESTNTAKNTATKGIGKAVDVASKVYKPLKVVKGLKKVTK